MSISNVASSYWTPNYSPVSGVGSPGRSFPTTDPDAARDAKSNAAAASAASGSSDPFQRLTADIQAVLLQAQSGSVGSTAAATQPTAASVAVEPATAATTATSPAAPLTAVQQLGADLKSLISQLQNGQASVASAANSATQTASLGQNGPVGGTEAHRHHHQHEDEGGAPSGTPASGSATASNAASDAAASPTVTEPVSGNPGTSRILAADITQALQSYTAASAGSAASSLTV